MKLKKKRPIETLYRNQRAIYLDPLENNAAKPEAKRIDIR